MGRYEKETWGERLLSEWEKNGGGGGGGGGGKGFEIAESVFKKNTERGEGGGRDERPVHLFCRPFLLAR